MTSTPPQQHSLRGLSPEQVKRLLDDATQLKFLWVAAMFVVAVVAAIEVTQADSGQYRWHVSVGTISIIAVALIWLPPLCVF